MISVGARATAHEGYCGNTAREGYSNGGAAMGALMQLNQSPSVVSYFDTPDDLPNASYSKAHD